MKVFVPVTDDMLDNPDLAELLVPYQPGIALASQGNNYDIAARYRHLRSLVSSNE